jgi:hypothetical protein
MEIVLTTLAHLIDRHGIEVLDYLDRAASVPVIAGLQAQGDVIVIPASMLTSSTTTASTPVPSEGFAVVRGESGGNTHMLLGDGPVFFDSIEDTNGRSVVLDLGVLTVPKGSTAYLAHPEHAYSGIAPGNYTIRRQREQAEEIRMVTD